MVGGGAPQSYKNSKVEKDVKVMATSGNKHLQKLIMAGY